MLLRLKIQQTGKKQSIYNIKSLKKGKYIIEMV